MKRLRIFDIGESTITWSAPLVVVAIRQFRHSPELSCQGRAGCSTRGRRAINRPRHRCAACPVALRTSRLMSYFRRMTQLRDTGLSHLPRLCGRALNSLTFPYSPAREPTWSDAPSTQMTFCCCAAVQRPRPRRPKVRSPPHRSWTLSTLTRPKCQSREDSATVQTAIRGEHSHRLRVASR